MSIEGVIEHLVTHHKPVAFRNWSKEQLKNHIQDDANLAYWHDTYLHRYNMAPNAAGWLSDGFHSHGGMKP